MNSDARDTAVQREHWLTDRILFWGPVGPLVALDLWSKHAAFGFLRETYPASLPDYIRHRVWEGMVNFSLVHWYNRGTIWGLFQGYNFPLVILRCVAVLLIVGYVIRLARPGRALQLVLGLILAGAIGNLYDNLTQEGGGVRDFLLFTFFPNSTWRYDFPAFNVADACISVGVISLILGILFEGRATAAKST